MLSHQPQHPLAADGQPAMSQSRAHLAVALPMERRPLQDAADRGEHFAVAHGGLRRYLIQGLGQAE
jgi:hypothetical protein